MNLNRLLGILAAVLLLAAAGLWVGSHAELKRVTSVVPPAAYVRADPFYALAQILAPTVTVKRYADAAKIDLATSAFVAIDGTALNKLGKARLAHWVAGGGLLLITLPKPAAAPPRSWWRGKGPFEGLAPSFGSAPPAAEQSPKGGPKPAAKKPVVLVDTTVSFPGAQDDRNTAVVTVDGVTKVAVRSWGKGKVIVCGEPLFLANRNLERDDDLQFAGSLFGSLLANPRGIAWLPSPPVPAVRPSRQIDVRPILVAALVVFLVLVWMKSPRFGPVLPEPDEDNRSLRLRFRAEGRFLWKYGAGDWILDRLHGSRRDRVLARSDPSHEVRTARESHRRRPTRQGLIEEVTELVTRTIRSQEDRRAQKSIGR